MPSRLAQCVRVYKFISGFHCPGFFTKSNSTVCPCYDIKIYEHNITTLYYFEKNKMESYGPEAQNGVWVLFLLDITFIVLVN